MAGLGIVRDMLAIFDGEDCAGMDAPCASEIIERNARYSTSSF